MTHRKVALLLSVVGLLAVEPGCSARSIVLGADPLDSEGEGVTGGATASGGAFASGGDGVGGNGSATGGVAVGGASGSFATGGTLVPIGGTSTGSGGRSAQGGADGGFDPYPRVAYENGQGYRSSCPEFGGTWGFTCWNYEGETRSCRPSGDPYCNACSCAVPCETGDECPLGITGHSADCISSATTVKSCFLVCDDRPCPSGMTCASYPGTERMVCIWVSEPPFGQPPS